MRQLSKQEERYLKKLPLTDKQAKMVRQAWQKEKAPTSSWLSKLAFYLYSPMIIAGLFVNFFITGFGWLPETIKAMAVCVWITNIILLPLFGFITTLVYCNGAGGATILDKVPVTFWRQEKIIEYIYHRFKLIGLVFGFVLNGYPVTGVFIAFAWIVFCFSVSPQRRKVQQVLDDIESGNYQEPTDARANQDYHQTYFGDNVNRNSHNRIKSPHEVLGVSSSATRSEIRKAYLSLSQQYHPDKYAHLAPDMYKQAEERFKEISSAYSQLMSQ